MFANDRDLIDQARGLLGQAFTIPHPTGKPALVTVDLPTPATFTVLCANQCVRDLSHRCSTAVTDEDLHDGGWVDKICQQDGWMLLLRGTSVPLPFCTAGCMLDFLRDEHSAILERVAVPPAPATDFDAYAVPRPN